MRIGVYFCTCGGSISDRIDHAAIARETVGNGNVAWVKTCDFLCGEEGKQFLYQDLVQNHPDRVVVAACSPREHEATFMRVAERAGLNPWFVQLANIREHIAWVTADCDAATKKASRVIAAAAARAALHEPLARREIDVSRDVLVIGGGPAGLKSALTLAQAGRKVVVVEKTPALGGAPVRYEEVFPSMECAPCMLEPLLGEVLHGEHSQNIEILTLSELVDVTGYYGNFTATIRQAARFVDTTVCIGCAECVAPCPQFRPNEFNAGMDERRAIALPFLGALPNAPFIDPSVCVRSRGDDCHLCRDVCPVPDAIVFDDRDKLVEKSVGAIVIATGFGVFDVSEIPALGYGRVPGVCSGGEFERMLASSGPTAGEISGACGRPPASVAIVHCVGSLDDRYRPYCSGVCCSYAFKFNHLIRKKLPGATVYHLYKEIAVSGKDEFALYRETAESADSVMIRYRNIDELRISAVDQRISVAHGGGDLVADLVILCPAMGPAPGTERLCRILDVDQDRFGFVEEMHGRMDAPQSKIRGIYIAGSCHAPMGIEKAVTDGIAAAGYVLSGLADGRKLTIDPVCASADPDRCSGCRVCGSVCSYKAISWTQEPERAQVNALLCHGCGTCVAACPSGAMVARHFTNPQLLAEMEALLQ